MRAWVVTLTSALSFVACGGRTGMDGPCSLGDCTANVPAPGPATASATGPYPKDLLAVLTNLGTVVNFFTYEKGAGFSSWGTLTLPSATVGSAIAFDQNRRLYVAGRTAMPTSSIAEILVFASGAVGDSAPIRTVGRSLGPVDLGSVAVDSAFNIYTLASEAAGSSTFYIFGPGADDAPVNSFEPLPWDCMSLLLDADDDVYTSAVGTVSLVMEYPARASGAETPIGAFGAAPYDSNGGEMAFGIPSAFDPAGRLYVAVGYAADAGAVAVFEPDGAVEKTITGTPAMYPIGLVLDSSGRIFVNDHPTTGAPVGNGGGADDWVLAVFAADAGENARWEAELQIDARGLAITR